MSVYRVVLVWGSGRVDTGASYPGCSSGNQAACDPQQFATVEDAVAYAEAHGEIPVSVQSDEEAFDVVEGRKAVTPDMILQGAGITDFFKNPLILGLGAIILWRMFKK